MKTLKLLVIAVFLAAPVAHAQNETVTVQLEIPVSALPAGPPGDPGTTPDLSDIYSRLDAIEAAMAGHTHGAPDPVPDPDPVPVPEPEPQPEPQPVPGGTLADLDLSVIPWHNGAGPWGPQVRLQLPAEPVTSRSVVANSLSEFNQAASVAGTEVIVETGWPESQTGVINASDVDVILPQGVTTGSIELGSWPREIPLARIRVRGAIIGEHSGGVMGTFMADGRSAAYTDIIIDGVDFNNALRPRRVNRFAVLNTRGISACHTWLGAANNLVVANSNFLAGASTQSCTTWAYRSSGGPVAFFNTHWVNPQYATIRTQPTTDSTDLFYATGSTFVNAGTGRNQWPWNDVGDGYVGEGAIYENSAFYSHSADGCGNRASSLIANTPAYTEIRGSNFYHAGTLTWTDSSLNNWLDVNQNNSIQPFSSLPPWGGPGDPSEIPLPGGATLDTNGPGGCTFP